MSILNQVKAKSILVVGDVMLDTYYNGEVTRISRKLRFRCSVKCQSRAYWGEQRM